MSEFYNLCGKGYRAVKRKAEVGEKVIVIKNDKFLNEDHIGEVHEVYENEGNLTYTTGKWDDGSTLNLSQDEYLVLEPIEVECCVDNSVDQSQLLDTIANLARRVSSLEQQLAATQRNLETFAEQTESNSQDIRDLDERLQPSNTDRSGAQLLAEAFEAMARYEKAVRG